MIIAPDSTNGKIEPVPCNIFMDSGYFKAEHHPFIIDGLVLFQQVLYRFVDGFGCSPFDDMAYPNFRQFNTFTWENPVGCFPYRFNEVGMRDCYFIVLAEYRYNTIIFKVFNGHILGVGFNERKSFYFPS